MAASKHMALCLAHETLVYMTKIKIHPADEVCYRVVMQLCGIYSQPLVAVKVNYEEYNNIQNVCLNGSGPKK